MPGKLDGSKSIENGTITSAQLATALSDSIAAGGGPKIKNLIYPGDDTAANNVGGQTIYINGSGFDSNVAVYVNNASVPSVTYISASNVGFTTPALSAATYPLYVTNPDDGATAILVPGLQISGEPTWVTGATLTTQDAAIAWSISLSATGDTPLTYALAAGSSLPSGISLASNGVISGTMSSPPASETTYNFTVDVSDAQNQSSSRAFSVTVTTGEGVLFANNVLLIHANGTNNGNNHSFLDSSNNNFTITRNGNATQGSFSPFSQTGWSALFDGTGDYLTVADNAALQMGSGDFTIEFWMQPTSTGVATVFGKGFTGSGAILMQTLSTSGRIELWVNGSLVITESSGTYSPNNWYHIAVVRSGTSLVLYRNGVSTGSVTNSVNLNSTASLGIGGDPTNLGYTFTGYISNFRMVKGTAVYTSTFTPPSAPLAPIANTSLLTCQDNNFIDEGPKNFAITRAGDVRIVPYSPCAPGLLSSNSHSVYFDGTGDYLTVADNAALRMGSGNFTIECWWQPNSLSSYQTLFDKGYTNVGAFLWQTGSGDGRIIIYTGGSTAITSNTAVVVGNWTHMALVRSGTTLTLYQNGVSVGSATNSTDFTSTATVGIGANATIPGGGSLYPINGSISNFRMVKGTAVYTSAFTPPTSALTAITNTSLLACQSATLIDNSTYAFTITAYGNAQPRTYNPFGQTYTSSAYSTANVGGSGYFDGTDDYLRITDNAAFDFGSGDFTIECWAYTETFASQYNVLVCQWGSSTAWIFRIQSTLIGLYANIGGTQNYTASVTNTTGQWDHFAVTRSGTTLTFYKNGVSVGTTSISGTINNAAETISIGVLSEYNSTTAHKGYISGLRVIKGSAIAPTITSPPTNIANTSLLCNFTNAQIFDQTAKINLECIGNVVASTAQYKYGSASMYFDGTGDYLFTPANKLFAFGTGDFTIEFWIRSTDSAGNLIGLVTNASGNWNLVIAGSQLYWQSQYGTTNVFNRSATGILDGAWHHVAITRASGTMRMFFDGTLQGATASDSADYTAPNAMQIGSSGVYGDFLGYIDDLRITKGYARYTANFTAPTAQFKYQ
jgi:hypothetical protein